MTGCWRWIRHDGTTLKDIGINPDGTLHNPNGYPEATVRTAIAAACERQRQKRSDAARKAAATRRRRQDRRVYDAARRIAEGHVYGPSENCFICGRGVDDPRSVQRGIGSDCWQLVLDAIAEGEPA